MQTKPIRRFLSHNKGDDGEERSVIELTFYSTPMVYLFHLPPHGQITLAGLPLRAHIGFDSSKFKELTVLEADNLLVNGKTPLDEWLPYKTMSDAGAKADRMDFFKPKTAGEIERRKKEEQLPKEPVESIQATHIRSWTARFQPPAEADRHAKPLGDGLSDSVNPYANPKNIGPTRRPKKTAPPNP